MVMYQIVYAKQIPKHISNLKACMLDKKAKELIEIIRNNPFQNPPPYEKLTGNLSGFYSRRINIKHRIVYQIFTDETNKYSGIVRIISLWSHYET